MKHATCLTAIWLTASLAACVSPGGDFCDVLRGPIEFQAATAAQIVATDRPSAETIRALNVYGARTCRW